jgi:acyl-CoA reductase-like NAD-dependent aldehyde dehydrogenase
MAIAKAAAPALMDRAHSWIANREVEGRAGRRAAVNPATGLPFAETTLLDAEQVDVAVEAARRAFPAWSARTFRERGQVLRRVHDLLLAQAEGVAALIAREQGKPEAEAHLVEVFPALEALDHLARHAE